MIFYLIKMNRYELFILRIGLWSEWTQIKFYFRIWLWSSVHRTSNSGHIRHFQLNFGWTGWTLIHRCMKKYRFWLGICCKSEIIIGYFFFFCSFRNKIELDIKWLQLKSFGKDAPRTSKQQKSMGFIYPVDKLCRKCSETNIRFNLNMIW